MICVVLCRLFVMSRCSFLLDGGKFMVDLIDVEIDVVLECGSIV